MVTVEKINICVNAFVGLAVIASSLIIYWASVKVDKSNTDYLIKVEDIYKRHGDQCSIFDRR